MSTELLLTFKAERKAWVEFRCPFLGCQRRAQQVDFVIFGLAIVRNGGVRCPMPRLPYLQGRVNSRRAVAEA